jgi:hypothetical protein
MTIYTIRQVRSAANRFAALPSDLPADHAKLMELQELMLWYIERRLLNEI